MSPKFPKEEECLFLNVFRSVTAGWAKHLKPVVAQSKFTPLKMNSCEHTKQALFVNYPKNLDNHFNEYLTLIIDSREDLVAL